MLKSDLHTLRTRTDEPEITPQHLEEEIHVEEEEIYVEEEVNDKNKTEKSTNSSYVSNQKNTNSYQLII